MQSNRIKNINRRIQWQKIWKKKMKISISQTNNGRNLRRNIKMYAENMKQKNKSFEKIERKRKGYQTNNQREI